MCTYTHSPLSCSTVCGNIQTNNNIDITDNLIIHNLLLVFLSLKSCHFLLFISVLSSCSLNLFRLFSSLCFPLF